MNPKIIKCNVAFYYFKNHYYFKILGIYVKFYVKFLPETQRQFIKILDKGHNVKLPVFN